MAVKATKRGIILSDTSIIEAYDNDIMAQNYSQVKLIHRCRNKKAIYFPGFLTTISSLFLNAPTKLHFD